MTGAQRVSFWCAVILAIVGAAQITLQLIGDQRPIMLVINGLLVIAAVLWAVMAKRQASSQR